MIKTNRLILRPWRKTDLEPFAALNADAQVMEHLPSSLSKEESALMMKRMQAKIEEKGWGFWAVSLETNGEFIGFIGMNDLEHTLFPAPFTPAVEIGWRLAYPFWGKGYATEGALACLKYGFDTLHLQEIVSFTATQNMRSRAVMERIGMHSYPKDDFDHPNLPNGHKLKRHVLYRLEAKEWQKQKRANLILSLER